MPALIGQQLNSSLVGTQSYSNNADRYQVLAFRLRQGAAWKISAISAGYLSQGNIGKTSPYQLDKVQGRVTIVKNDFGLFPTIDRDDVVNNYSPLQSAITFPNIGEVVFDTPIIDYYKESYSGDVLAFQPSDTVIVMLSVGLTAIDVGVTNFTAKVAFLNVFGGPLDKKEDNGNFKYPLR